MYHRIIDLKYDKLVIGSDLSAFTFSLTNDCSLIYTRILYPHKYNEKENWEILRKDWEQKAYCLLNNNKIPFSDKIVSLRLEEANVLKAATKMGVILNIKYNNLFISDDYNLEGLPPTCGKTNYDNWVLDWFDVLIGSKHNLNYICDDSEEFVKKIYFYPTVRGYKQNTRKDLVAVSKINDENLYNFDYSETMARMKILNMFKKSGINGNWDVTNKRFIKPKLISTKREVYSLGKNIYNNLSNNIEIIYE